MRYRIVPIVIVVMLVVLGHILRRIRIKKLQKRKEFTITYQNNFIDMVNRIFDSGVMDQALYNKCIHDVDKIQAELGQDGMISEFIDPLHGIKGRNYQLFVNIMPELRMMISMRGNSVAVERGNQLVGLCDDALRKHVGNIDYLLDEINSKLFNPFSCFGEGIRWFVGLPIDIMLWCGLIGDGTNDTIKKNFFYKIISNLIVFIGLIGSIVTIVLGWDEMIQIMKNILD